MGKVRLVDIAQRLGVSSVTVHNALNGSKGVSAELQKKILETAEEMGYQKPSSSEKKKAADTEFYRLGVLIAENYLAQYSTYYWKLYQELSLIATEKHFYTTIEVLKKETEKKTLESPNIARGHGIDGLIIIGELDMNYIRALNREISVPIVYLDFYDREIASNAVVADNFHGMYEMTELLFENGIKTAGFIGSIHATSSIMDRYCGFMKSIWKNGIQVPEEWIIEDRDELGQIAFELPKILPEAFVCNCDWTAGLLMEKLQERGLKVPRDISVVSFDNFLYSTYADMKITSYEVNTKAMCKVAIDKMLKCIRYPNRPGSLEVVSGRVVWKNSIKTK